MPGDPDGDPRQPLMGRFIASSTCQFASLVALQAFQNQVLSIWALVGPQGAVEPVPSENVNR